MTFEMEAFGLNSITATKTRHRRSFFSIMISSLLHLAKKVTLYRFEKPRYQAPTKPFPGE
jgi:hypothetical protein